MIQILVQTLHLTFILVIARLTHLHIDLCILYGLPLLFANCGSWQAVTSFKIGQYRNSGAKLHLKKRKKVSSVHPFGAIQALSHNLKQMTYAISHECAQKFGFCLYFSETLQ